jgi:hypothetical protein
LFTAEEYIKGRILVLFSFHYKKLAKDDLVIERGSAGGQHASLLPLYASKKEG